MASDELVEAHGLKPEDFEHIRDAVMETPRGRWFLGEYASRLRSAETRGLLDSMKRLEGAVSANHDALMARLSQALANPSAPQSSAPQPELAPKHRKFFKQDEEIFEPAPQARIAAVPAPSKPEAKPEAPKGAKVIIRRSSAPDVTPAPEAVGTEPAAQAAPPSAVPEAPAPEPQSPPPAEAAAEQSSVTAPDHEGQPKRRITIIRHKPGEDIDVPLQNNIAEAS
jgi:hypothetical protein